MSVFDWIEMARELDADGLELYSGFLTDFNRSYLDTVGEALSSAGYVMPMFCCSPDLTAPNEEDRKREIEREAEMIAVTRYLGGAGSVCRILSGQRYPEVSWEQGSEWVLSAIHQLLPVAREHGVVLGMENHYKDGFWQYPEFAQKMDRFLYIVSHVEDRQNFGVQYDPSNALVAGDDPVALLSQVVDRVVSMHASDRYLSPGATLEDLRQSDGTLGYSSAPQHGVTGRGLNDYPAIFGLLAQQNYSGWISIEDGMNGMEEMAASLAFLRSMIAQYFSA